MLLTSVMKGMDVAVQQAIKDSVDDNYSSEPFVGTLENEGVGLADFHDYDDQVSQEVKDEIAALADAIIAGDISPSDYYGE